MVQPAIYTWSKTSNILLSFSVLMAGASISKVLLICKHLGLSVFNVRTFFYHQKKYLFPPHYYQILEDYRASLITSLQKVKDLVWCGDGRFDSMGHSAKYGVYTMFCSSFNKCVHFELLQVKAILF